ncbi:hypothetical protein A3K73_01025 [Candidatus Pacearchaeota archaeon RBG_13_36_9]|nr:MAG: hypothetical protein A3K73_01025 [Candidatus Pacearchaeota archaeon RBG_13_36_9]HJX50086.1 DUF2330 domain-containing protein [Candidatus Nanoarchaeia archaeon]
MKRRFIVFCLLILVVGSVLVCADGGFFKPDLNRNEDLYEPEQKALIIFDKPIETLIIQASYTGNLSNFAWIVPVPAYPQLEESNSLLFEELHYLTQPDYIEKISVWGLLGISTLSAKGIDGVTVHEQSSIGIFDTAILSSTDENSLINWLNNNSYYVPESASQIIGEYVKKNWYFVAIRVNNENNPILKLLKQVDDRISDKNSALEYLRERILEAAEKKDVSPINSILSQNILVSENNNDSEVKVLTVRDFEKLVKLYNSEGINFFDAYLDVSVGYSGGSNTGYHFGIDFYTGSNTNSRGYHNNLDIFSSHKVKITDVEDFFEINLSQYSLEYYPEMGTAYTDEARERQIRENSLEKELENYIKKQLFEDIVNNRTYENSYLRKYVDKASSQNNSKIEEFYNQLLKDYYNPEGLLKDEIDVYLNRAFYNLNDELIQKIPGHEDVGILEPIKITFNSDEIIYPFKITSVNPGETEVLLYTLTDYRTQISGFKTEYADWLNIKDIPAKDYRIYGSQIDWSYLKELVGEKQYFLTKHRAGFKTDEISGDIVAEKADNKDRYIARTFEGGFASWILSLIIFIVVLYGIILAISLVLKTILNAIIKDKASAFYFSWLRWFIYPLIYPLLFSLFVFESIRNLISRVIVFLLYYPPVIAPMILITIIHFCVSGILYLLRKPVKNKKKNRKIR